jgi:hypothetical protein
LCGVGALPTTTTRASTPRWLLRSKQLVGRVARACTRTRFERAQRSPYVGDRAAVADHGAGVPRGTSHEAAAAGRGRRSAHAEQAGDGRARNIDSRARRRQRVRAWAQPGTPGRSPAP